MNNPIATIRVVESAPLVRATTPLPPGFEWKPKLCPFGVMVGGSLEPCQWEKVAPNADDSTLDIVELIFPSSGPGTYEIHELPAPIRDKPCQPGRWARKFIETPPMFARGPGQGMEDTTWDARDNGQRAYFRNGRYCQTARFVGEHVMGFVTVFDALDVVVVEFELVNGAPGSADFFFDTLAYLPPMNASTPQIILHRIPQPQAKGIELVPPRADGKLHALERKGTAQFKMVLGYSEAERPVVEALAYRRDFGLSLSWQHTYAAGLQPHGLPMPDLSTRAKDLLAEVRGRLADRLEAIEHGWLVGPGAPNPPKTGGRMDFKSIEGDWNGATTGGADRRQWEGYHVTATAHPDAVLELEVRAALLGNRMACAITRPNGMPVELPDWLGPDGRPEGGWDVSNAGLWFERSGSLEDQKDGAFGFAKRTNAGIDPARIPPELALMSTFQPGGVNLIDNDHFDRAGQPELALAILTNDPLAIWRCRMYLSMFEMQLATSGFRGECANVRQTQAHGTTFGRNPAHMFAFAAGAYRLSPPRIRRRWDALFVEWIGALYDAQAPSGAIGIRYRKESDHPPFGDGTPNKGVHALAKGTEEALLVNSVMAIRGTGALGPGAWGLAGQLVVRWVTEGLWGFLWKQGATGGSPSNFVAARPRAFAAEPYEVAPVTSGNDGEEIGGPLGLALWLEPSNPTVQAAVLRYCGNAPNLTAARTWLLSQPTAKLRLDDVCPLLAALERAP